jgi:hypothetical protein
MSVNKGVLAASLATVAVLAFGWQPGQGIQTEFPQDQWVQIRQEMSEARLSHLRVEFSKRSRAYDYSGEIQTPFFRGADFVQGNKGRLGALTYDEVMARANPEVVGVVLETQHMNRANSQAVLLALKVDGRTIQPFRDTLNSCILKIVGYYGERRFVTNRSFYFESKELMGAKSLEVLLFEDESKVHTIEIPVQKLR